MPVGDERPATCETRRAPRPPSRENDGMTDDGARFQEITGNLTQPYITCPHCGMTSYNVHDIQEGYCGNCHEWSGLSRPGAPE